MSVRHETVNPVTKYHLMAEAFLCLVIAFLAIKLSSKSPDININTQGFPPNNVVNFSLLPDGNFVISNNKGEPIGRPVPGGMPSDDPLRQLHGISVAVTEDIDKSNSVAQNLSFLDKIIAPAMATAHNLPGRRYYNYSWSIGNQRGCTRYDITNYPPTITNVGACI